MPYQIEIVADARRHVRLLPARDQRVVIEAIRAQLRHQPTVETRNRKRLRPNTLASWELRVGTFRVFYDVEDEPQPVVTVLAVGAKQRETVYIDGKEANP